MAVRTPLWLQAGTYSAELDRLVMLLFAAPSSVSGALSVRSGVLAGLGNSMAVSQTTTASMQLQVATGVAVIQGTQSVTQGAYALINDAVTNVTVTTASATNPRIDLVVLEVLDAAYSGSSNLGQLRVVPGTPSSSPVVPTLPANSIPLARVQVATNATSVSSANITDLRPFTSSRDSKLIATSTTRPSSPVRGMQIYETDTGQTMEYQTANTGWTKPWNVSWGKVSGANAFPAGTLIPANTPQSYLQVPFTYYRNRRYRIDTQFQVQTENGTAAIRQALYLYFQFTDSPVTTGYWSSADNGNTSASYLWGAQVNDWVNASHYAYMENGRTDVVVPTPALMRNILNNTNGPVFLQAGNARLTVIDDGPVGPPL